MLVAQDKQGRLIYAWNAKKATKYFCPECHNLVRYCHGKHKQQYFAHFRRACKHGGPESNEHLLGKKQIFNWVGGQHWEARLEQYLPTISQRPDIIAQYKSQKVVIEFQCSPLSLKRMIERNNGYRQLNMAFYWYLGSPYQVALHRNKQAQFTQVLAGKPALFFWNIQQSRPQYLFLSTQTATTLNRFKTEYDLEKLLKHWPALSETAYRQHHLLLNCPLFVHRSDASLKLTSDNEFTWRVLLCLKLEQLPLGTHWPYSKWENWVAQQTDWLQMPCVPTKIQIFWRKQKIDLFLKDLIISGCLTVVREYLVFVLMPHWFNNATEKIATMRAYQINNR